MFFFTNNKDEDRILKYILFIFWPIGAFVYSLRTLQSRSSRVIFFLICLVFGLCIECDNDEFDMFRLTDGFLSYKYIEFNEIKGVILDYLSGIGVRDIYEHILCWGVNQISSNEHVFWMIASIIYAFFYIKSLSFILDDSHFKSCFVGFLIVMMFTMPEPIFSVTGLRFWTAGWIAIFCSLKIFIYSEYKYCILLLLTPLIHVTYWIYIFLFLLTFVARINLKILIIIFLLSYPFSYLSMSYIFNLINMNILPSSLEMIALSYTDEGHLEEFNRQGTGWFWVSEMFDYILSIYYFIMVLLIIKNKSMIKDKQNEFLFAFILVFYSFANFTLIIPHLGIRYLSFVRILLPLLWFKLFGLKKHLIIFMYLPCASYYILWKRLVMNYAEVLNWDFLYDSFIVMILKNLIFYK